MDQLEMVNNKLDVIIKIIASGAVETKTFDEKILYLSNIGFDNNAIAEILGAKSTTVKTRKSQLKTKLRRK